MPTLIQEFYDEICCELLNGKQYDAKAVYTFALSGKENWDALERYCSTIKSLCLIDFCNENADSRTIGNKILKFQVERLIDLLGNSLESLDIPYILSDNYSTFVERFIDTICEAQKLVELSTDTVSILTQITNKCSKSLKRIKTRCYALPSEPPRDLYLDSLDLQVHNVHSLKEILEKCYRTKSLTLDLFNNLSCSDLVNHFDGVQK
uniref:Uncharacterized protein n=1 Tax=Panagrolaimus sp. PS1159 TaxID=55785 RepID=A0AC35G7M5_9BILA